MGTKSADHDQPVRSPELQAGAAPIQPKPMSEPEFERQLSEAGLLTVPNQTPGLCRRIEPISIKGDSLSQALIHDRR